MSDHDERKIWTLEPDRDVESLMDKAITARCGKNGNRRGQRTAIIQEALRAYLTKFRGKREGVSA